MICSRKKGWVKDWILRQDVPLPGGSLIGPNQFYQWLVYRFYIIGIWLQISSDLVTGQRLATNIMLSNTVKVQLAW